MIELPKKGTKRYQMCVNFIRSGYMTLGSYIEEYGLMGFSKPYGLRAEFDELIKKQCLRYFNERYSPTVALLSTLKMDDYVYVEPRIPPPFKPMESKHYLPKVSPRGDEIRQISYIGMGKHVAAGTETTDTVSVLNEVLSGLQAE